MIIKKLIRKINLEIMEWAYAYHAKDKSIVSDLEYDAKFNMLKKLVKETGYHPQGCMVNVVGTPSFEQYNKAVEEIKRLDNNG